MIIDRVEDKEMHLSEDLPILNLPKLGIAPEHYEAIEKGCEGVGAPRHCSGCGKRMNSFFDRVGEKL